MSFELDIERELTGNEKEKRKFGRSMEKPKLLVVEDDENIRMSMKWALASDYEVLAAGDGKAAMEVFKAESPPLVTLDLGLPPDPDGPEEGFKALEAMIRANRFVKVVVISGQDEKTHAVQAVQGGAYDFFCKPIKVEDLKVVLQRALHLHHLEKEHESLKRQVRDDSFEGILGTSPPIQDLLERIRRAATTKTPVLLQGESGTGKELVARAIHRRSDRRDRPFVAINCGAIPASLMESELFGHEKGSFTGAHKQHKGRIESAEGGTVFFDEVGELSPDLQVKLLRFLQEGCITRVGGNRDIEVDVRVVSATNRDLREAMGEDRFREDLYYRLGVIVVELPRLLDRGRDVTLLASYFLNRYADQENKKITGFTKKALKAIETYHWPGNVRELENCIRRAVVMARGGELTPADLELPVEEAVPDNVPLKEARKEFEKQFVTQALTRNKWNLTRTASEIGVSRPTLYEMIEKLGIEKE